MHASIIVAMTPDRVIGINGALPWHLSDDLRRFKRLTMTHTMIMGRKTFDSIGRPLPGRSTIVVTRQRQLQIPGARTVANFSDALKLVPGRVRAFAVGGASIYREALPVASEIYRTLVHAEVAGDTYFPEMDMAEWNIVEENCYAANERNPYDTTFQHLVRKR